jgi:hypothetical protein
LLAKRLKNTGFSGEWDDDRNHVPEGGLRFEIAASTTSLLAMTKSVFFNSMLKGPQQQTRVDKQGTFCYNITFAKV